MNQNKEKEHNYVRSLGVICYKGWCPVEGYKNYLKDLVRWHPNFLIYTSFWLNEMAILSKVSKRDNFESRNSN